MDIEIQRQLFGLLWTIVAGAFFVLIKWLNVRRERVKLDFIHRERLAAMERGIPMPEVADYDGQRTTRVESLLAFMRVNPRWPIGAGILLILGGAGTLIAMRLSGDPYHQQVWPFGLIPIFLGVGLWLHYLAMRPRDGR